jgi:hypothetical protein
LVEREARFARHLIAVSWASVVDVGVGAGRDRNYALQVGYGVEGIACGGEKRLDECGIGRVTDRGWVGIGVGLWVEALGNEQRCSGWMNELVPSS